LSRQPTAILHGGVMSDADYRVPFSAVAEGLVGVRLGWSGDGVGVALEPFLVVFGGLDRLFLPIDVEFIPGDLRFAHPKWPDRNRVWWPFIGVSPFFASWTSHQKSATGNRHHFELHFRSRNRLHISAEVRRFRRLACGRRRFECQPAGRADDSEKS